MTGLTRSQKRIKKQLDNDVAALLKHPPSMRFICRIFDVCGMHDDPFTGARRTDYNIGRRKTGLHIMEMLERVDKDAHLKLLQLAANERRKNQTAPEPKDRDYEP